MRTLLAHPLSVGLLLASSALAVLTSAGCTAGKATYQLAKAQQAYQQAVSAGSAERAPYETTLAFEYLQKAKEENGYSDFGAADELCLASMKYAQQAFEKASDIIPSAPDDGEVPEDVPDKAPATPKKPASTPLIDLDDDL